MDLHDLTPVLTAEGPFVTVLVDAESDVEQAAAKYDLTWRNALKDLQAQGVDGQTLEALSQARGEHGDGAARYVVASQADHRVHLAASLSAPPRRPLAEVAPLPRLRPLVDDLTARVPHVVVLADRTGADVTALYDADRVAGEVTVEGGREIHLRKIGSGGWSHLRYLHKAEEGWAANAEDIASAVRALAARVDAELVVVAGDERELGLLRQALPTDLRARVVEVPGGRGGDGSEDLVRARVADAVARHVAEGTLDLLADYAQERGQGKRAVDGLADVVEALRKAQVQTLLITTQTEPGARLWFGPEPTQIATTDRELVELGVADPQEGPLVDVLIRAAVGTSADVQLVPGETEQAPQAGLGAVLRYADALTGSPDGPAGSR